MRGRLPSGPEYVEHLEGSTIAKQRVKVILETMAGTCRVQEACQRLGISEPRFEQLRILILQAALERLEPRPAGRPAHTLTHADERIGALEAQLADMKTKLQVSQARTEIALALPNALQNPPGSEDGPLAYDDGQNTGASDARVNDKEVGNDAEKKTRRQRPSARARAPTARKST